MGRRQGNGARIAGGLRNKLCGDDAPPPAVHVEREVVWSQVVDRGTIPGQDGSVNGDQVHARPEGRLPSRHRSDGATRQYPATSAITAS